MTAYYNEFDPFAAQWLRNLIQAGHIAPGVVDERSIEDVKPSDLAGFTQCHFFAGVGVWSLALRRAGWPDDVPVWTGSCPCQPFSAAGAGAGFADARHLWPSFAWLIKQCRPAVVFGEQVASKAADSWIDLVQADLEAMDHAFGAIAFPSASIGAPHIRDRAYWVADSQGYGHQRAGKLNESSGRDGIAHLRATDGMEHSGQHDDAGEIKTPGLGKSQADRSSNIVGGPSIPSGGMAHADGRDSRTEREQCSGQQRQQPQDSGSGLERVGAGPVNGFWRAADWIGCRDDKWRPVEPGSFPLAHGATARVGRLRAYGNAINAEAAHEFIAAYLECI